MLNKIKEKYPKTYSFIIHNKLDENHYLSNMNVDDPILVPLEYFFSLNKIEQYDDKINEIKRNAIKTFNNNVGEVQWASLCAELGAIYIIGKQLSYNILGFEQKSPRSQTSKTCDIKANKDGNNQYFEVKRKSSQTTQHLPINLQKFLIDFKCHFKLSAKLNNRQYQCHNFEILRKNLMQHIKNWKQGKLKAFPYDVPTSYSDTNLTIHFHKEGYSGSGFFQPDGIQSINHYLFEKNRINKNGKQMIPMVFQAEQKGADYLCCRVPDWDARDSWDLMIKSFFNKYQKITSTEYETANKKMNELKGLILFSRYDKYCIINNSIMSSN